MTAPAGNQKGIGPQETVERALAAARCDDCIVIADETSQASLRDRATPLVVSELAAQRRFAG